MEGLVMWCGGGAGSVVMEVCGVMMEGLEVW